MIGAIIGDIVGSRFEFNPLKSKTDEFELFSSDCNFTDDTVCTVAIADAIMNRNNDFTGSLVDWCSRYTFPMGGYGGKFQQWIKNPVPYDSFGNGSAMRVSPCAWLNEKMLDVVCSAKDQSCVSHSHPEGIAGAQATAYAIWLSRSYSKIKSKKEISNMALSQFGYETECDIEQYIGKFYETMQETIPAAFWAFRRSIDFETAIRNAIAIRGDADTLGAITGSIAHAYYGVPRYFYDRAMEYLPDDMIAIVEQFNSYTNGQKIY